MAQQSRQPILHFADRAFRKMLAEPINLQAFLRRALPDSVERLDFSRIQFMDRTSPFEDWRDRECDLLFEIPYRVSDSNKRDVLICILLEHQTQTDRRMPLRTLVYTVLYWDRQQQAWEKDEREDKGPFHITPVIPIVLYAAPRPWGSARTLADLLGDPVNFHVFAPRWEPMFWELSQHSAEELLNSESAFDQFLAVVRSEEADADDFGDVFQRVFTQLQQKSDNRVYLIEMLQLVFLWAMWRRPDAEQERWSRVVDQVVKDAEETKRIKAMSQSVIEKAYEKGREHGVEQGITQGIEQGQELGLLKATRQTLLRVGRKHLGEPTAEQLQAVEACSDRSLLDLWVDRALDVPSWADVLR